MLFSWNCSFSSSPPPPLGLYLELLYEWHMQCIVRWNCSWHVLIWGAVARHHAAPGHQIKVFDTGEGGQTREKPMQIQGDCANSPRKGPGSWIQPKTFSLKSVQVWMSDHSSEEPRVVSEELEAGCFFLRWILCRSILLLILAWLKPHPPWCTGKNLFSCRLRAFVMANFFRLSCGLMKAAKN